MLGPGSTGAQNDVLMIHEVSDRVDEGALPAGLGLHKARHQKHRGRRLGKRFMSCTGSVADGEVFSRRGR